jgi:hypothetical protein
MCSGTKEGKRTSARLCGEALKFGSLFLFLHRLLCGELVIDLGLDLLDESRELRWGLQSPMA